jgi:hypothetical protein
MPVTQAGLGSVERWSSAWGLGSSGTSESDPVIREDAVG